MEARTGDPSVGELLGALVRESGSLVRQELHLARTEMTEKVTNAASKGGSVLVGGALAHAGLLTLIAAVIIALANVVPLWLSALVIGGVLTVTGYVMAHAGVSDLKKMDPLPGQTIATINNVISPASGRRATNEILAKERAS